MRPTTILILLAVAVSAGAAGGCADPFEGTFVGTSSSTGSLTTGTLEGLVFVTITTTSAESESDNVSVEIRRSEEGDYLMEFLSRSGFGCGTLPLVLDSDELNLRTGRVECDQRFQAEYEDGSYSTVEVVSKYSDLTVALDSTRDGIEAEWTYSQTQKTWVNGILNSSTQSEVEIDFEGERQ